MNRFFELYNLAPDIIKEEIEKTKYVNQSPYWHPEGKLYQHIIIVTNRLHNTFNDINLDLCGFFHDLGKIYTTEEDKENHTFHSNDHETISVEIINQDDFRYFIKSMGGNFDLISFVIENHMRVKHLGEMSKSKQDTLISNEYFNYLFSFTRADYGGDNPDCLNITLEEFKKLPYDTKLF